jgi:hypothetical protein
MHQSVHHVSERVFTISHVCSRAPAPGRNRYEGMRGPEMKQLKERKEQNGRLRKKTSQ